MLCLLGHLGRSGARGAPATAADAGELVEARGDIVGRFGGLELIVQVLRRFVPDMQDLFAQLERQLGEGRCPGQRRDPAYHQGQRFHQVGASALAGRASELEQALRRADRCAAWKSSPASASTNCAPCAMPACSACRRCSATCRRSRRAEPRRGGQSAKDSGGPGPPASAAACRANNAMGVIRRYSWKPAQVLSDILFLSFSAFRRRAAGRGR